MSWATKSRGKKEVNFKKRIKNINCPWFQQKNANHMNPRNAEMPISWVPLPDQWATVQKVWGLEPDKQDLHLGFVTGQLCEPVATRVVLVQGGNNAFHAGQITEITWDNMCADPAQRRSSTSVGSHPPDSSWIIPDSRVRIRSCSRREKHAGGQPVWAHPNERTQRMQGTRVYRNHEIMKHLISFQRGESFSFRCQMNSQMYHNQNPSGKKSAI